MRGHPRTGTVGTNLAFTRLEFVLIQLDGERFPQTARHAAKDDQLQRGASVQQVGPLQRQVQSRSRAHHALIGCDQKAIAAHVDGSAGAHLGRFP